MNKSTEINKKNLNALKKTALKVLLVDDDDITNVYNTQLLQRVLPNAEIATTEDPEEALHALFKKADNIPDWVFVDLHMPSMSGWEFLMQFSAYASELYKTPKLFILSGSIDEADRQRALLWDVVVDIYAKPFSEETIEEIILEQLD